jgi:hypothetical protein
VLLQHFALTPNVASLGRELDRIPAGQQSGNPIVARFWTFHGIYSGCEILKMVLIAALGIRLATNRRVQNG